MQIRLMDEAEAKQVYEERMVRDFPEDELKPFAAILQMMRGGIYEPLGFYDETGHLCAYAWQTVMAGRSGALIDYFAVDAAQRGQGTGHRALQLLAEYYALRMGALIIECEHPAEAPDAAIARRRIRFYLDAGARATALESRVFGVKYQIYALPCGKDPGDAVLNDDLQALYRAMVPEPYYRGNVIFYGA